MEKSQTYQVAPSRGRPSNASEVVDYLINSALRLEASDIHLGINHYNAQIEPYLVRFRIHGKLQMVRSDFIGPFYRETIARMKVLAGISTTEFQVPQDGQITANTALGPIALRLATIPNQDSEEVVIRIQRANDQRPALTQLPMTPEMSNAMGQLIRQKSGIIILNGPAGSGKTTTIYAILGAIASPEKKVITAEDPVEMRLPYVSHTQVTPKTDYAVLAKAFMRQDADVIFIGEIRDPVSAEAAIQLSQTGHLVLTTLHTRDAIGVISRLEAFDIHPNFIATALIGSLAQRLIPKLCPGCRVEYKPKEKLLKGVSKILPLTEKAAFYKAGPGCPNCSQGIAGRIPIFELFVADPELSEMINQRRSKQEIIQVAKTRGMKTLAEEALLRVYEGYIDLASVYSFVFAPSYD